MLRPDPNVTVATTTTTARMEPRMADRTGTAVRPAPGSSAKRTPVTAAGGRPAVLAAVVDARRGDPVGAARGASRNRQERSHQRDRPERGGQDGHTEAHDSPVDVHLALDERPYRSEGCQRRETDGHGSCEDGTQHDGARSAEEPVRDVHRRARPERAGDGEIG